MNRAIYGDIHGCIDELKRLHKKIQKQYPGIEHWHLGDLFDRGPDSGAVTAYVRQHFTGGIMGNHEENVLGHYKRYKKTGDLPGNPDKANTIETMEAQENSEELWQYVKDLPYLHVFDDVGLLLVHGGILPKIALHKQPPGTLCRLQMVNVQNPMQPRTRWWGGDARRQPKVGKSEMESRKEGYLRWYEAYDHKYDVIYGHSVMGLEPFIHQNEGYGKCIGIDTGSCFGGKLTAFIYPEMKYEQVDCQEYVLGKNVRDFKLMK